MKKVYSILVALLPLFANAQTITQSDLPTAGDAWLIGNDSVYTGPVGTAGTGQTWDFSSVLQNDDTDTIGFTTASSTPYASMFPNSNLAAGNPLADTYSYFTSNSTGLYIDGLYSNGFSFSYAPSQLFIPVPFTYGDTRLSTYAYELTDGVTYRIATNVQSTFTADGSGTLILPNNQTFSNVLRIKNVDLSTDSTFLDVGTGFQLFDVSSTQRTTYRYYRSGGNVNYLLTIDADSLGQVAASADFFLGTGPVSVSSVDSKSISAYPNPADQFITLNAGELNSFSFTIHDITGKQVLSGSTDSGSVKINSALLPAGIYYYNVSGDNKSLTGKFVVKH